MAREYFAAISRHGWSEVWKLGGKYIGRGQYASYRGMISGYSDTIRDVPILLKARVQTVSGEFLAYRTDDEVAKYDFTYVVRQGVIASASQRLVGTTSES